MSNSLTTSANAPKGFVGVLDYTVGDQAAPVLPTVYWLMTFVALAAAIVMVFAWTPEERSMGLIQKIFYLHLPVAINTFLACLTVFIASIGYLWQRRLWWDDLAAAAAKVAVVYCSVVLLTGMFWARGAWGVWWLFSPRLTFSLVLWFLYVVYLLLRSGIDSGQRRAVIGAVYGIIAFLDVPLVWLSARLMPDMHPGHVALAPAMTLTLAVWFVPMTLLAVGLIVVRYGLNRQITRSLASSSSWDSAESVATRAMETVGGAA